MALIGNDFSEYPMGNAWENASQDDRDKFIRLALGRLSVYGIDNDTSLTDAQEAAIAQYVKYVFEREGTGNLDVPAFVINALQTSRRQSPSSFSLNAVENRVNIDPEEVRNIVDEEVEDWAQAGNEDLIPSSKLPASSGGGLDQQAVENIVANKVEDWAEDGNTDPIPAEKLTNAPSGSGEATLDIVPQTISLGTTTGANKLHSTGVSIGASGDGVLEIAYDIQESGFSEPAPAAQVRFQSLRDLPVKASNNDAYVASGASKNAETIAVYDANGEVVQIYAGLTSTNEVLIHCNVAQFDSSSHIRIGKWTIEGVNVQAGGGGNGLTQSQVDARVRAGVSDWAEQGDTTTIPDNKIPSSIARDTEVPTNSEIDARADARVSTWARQGNNTAIPSNKLTNAPKTTNAEIDARISDWAQEGNDDAIPANKLTNAPSSGGGGGGGAGAVLSVRSADKSMKNSSGEFSDVVSSVSLPANYDTYDFVYITMYNGSDMAEAWHSTDSLKNATSGLTSFRVGGTQDFNFNPSSRALTDADASGGILDVKLVKITPEIVAQNGNEILLNTAPITAWTARDGSNRWYYDTGLDWANSDIGDSDLYVFEIWPALGSSGNRPVCSTVASGVQIKQRTQADTLFTTNNEIFARCLTASQWSGTNNDAYVFWRSLDNSVRISSSASNTNDHPHRVHIFKIGGGSSSSSGGGLDTAGVDARILSWARTGNTSTLPDNKIPNLSADKITSGTINEARLPASATTTNADIDNRIQDWAQEGNTEQIPANKLANAPDTNTQRSDGEINTLADARIAAGVEDWARDNSTAIPANKLTNAPSSGGGGLTQAQVDARVAAGVEDWAEAGNDDLIPAEKLANAPAATGLNQAEVDARVAAGVEDWAETGNDDAIPADKLTNAPGNATLSRQLSQWDAGLTTTTFRDDDAVYKHG